MRFTHLCAATAVVFLRGAPVTEARTFRPKRDATWVPSDPRAFEIQLGFDSVGRHVVPIGMGKPFAQVGNFSFLLSTSSPYTGVVAADCATCIVQVGQAAVYNISKSSSASLRGTKRTFNIGSGTISGELIYEDCSLRKVKSSGWSYDNQTILLIQSTEGIFGSGVSGFVGFGRSSGNDSYISGITNSQGWKNTTFGFALNKFIISTADATPVQSAGSLTVGGVNPNLFTGEVYWQPLAQITDVPKDTPTDWAIKFDSYKLSFGSQSTISSGGVAIIETYLQELRIPSNEAMDFFNNIPNAKMTNDTISLSWVVPCDHELSLSITIGGSTYRMKNEQLISLDTAGTVCTSLVKGWADPVVREYLFGTPFTTSVYFAYNAQEDQSGDQIGVAARVGDTIIIINQGVSTTLLVAAIVGSIAGITFVASVIFFFLHRRRRRGSETARPLDGKDKFKIEPFTSSAPPNSASPILSTITGQNGWIIEQGPVGGEPGEGRMLKHEPGSSLNSARSLDRKGPLPSPHLVLVRQSQATDSSDFSPSLEQSPSREEPHAVQPLAPLNHTLYGAHIPTLLIAPEPERQRHLSSEAPDQPAPPPYSRAHTNTRATAGVSSLREKR